MLGPGKAAKGGGGGVSAFKGGGSGGKGGVKDGKGKGQGAAKIENGERPCSGHVRLFNAEKGHGFIANCRDCDDQDVYAFKNVLETGLAGPGDLVAFFLHWSPKNQPQASHPLLRISCPEGVGVYALKGYFKTGPAGVAHGFISCPETKEFFGRDVYVHKEMAATLGPGQCVAFNCHLNQDRMPMISELEEVDDSWEPTPGDLSASWEADVPIKGKGKSGSKGGEKGGHGVGKAGYAASNYGGGASSKGGFTVTNHGAGTSSQGGFTVTNHGAGAANRGGFTASNHGGGAASKGGKGKVDDWGKGHPQSGVSSSRPGSVITGFSAAESYGHNFDKGRKGAKGGLNPPEATGETYTGVVKSFNADKNYGFIECQEVADLYGGVDCFCHGVELWDKKVGETVVFEVGLNKEGKPQGMNVQSYGSQGSARKQKAQDSSWGGGWGKDDSWGKGGHSSQPQASVSGARPGDWQCPKCNQLVFATKNACNSCGQEKTADITGFSAAECYGDNIGKGRKGAKGGKNPPEATGETYIGVVKSFNADKNYGFIECQEVADLYGGVDCFCHGVELWDKKVGETVVFEVGLNKEGKPQGMNVQREGGQEDEPPAKKQRSAAYGGYQEPSKGGWGKADSSGKPGKGRKGEPVSNVSGARPGDWQCPACEVIVFAKKNVCHDCGYEKTEDITGFSAAELYGDSYGNNAPPRGGKNRPEGTGTEYVGVVKSFNAKMNYGFIECQEVAEQYGGVDCFSHGVELWDKKVGEMVLFELGLNKEGKPQAMHVQKCDEGSEPPAKKQKTATYEEEYDPEAPIEGY